MKFKFCLLVTFFFLQLVKAQQQVTITVNASDTIGEMKPFWSFFGYDEPNYTTRANGKKLLKELKDLSPTKVYIRTHNLLTSKGNSKGPDLKWGFTDAYKEDANGNAVYNWITVDSIVDVFIKGGMKPLMEIGFMPEDLAAKPEPYEHNWSKGGNLWTGWTSPPKDYNKWRELIYQWVKHSIERYGKEEVTTWLWEVWNEPDIPYWSGSFDEYCKLYDYASDGLKKLVLNVQLVARIQQVRVEIKVTIILQNLLSIVYMELIMLTAKQVLRLVILAFMLKVLLSWLTGIFK